MSWGWRKLLQIRYTIRPFIWHKLYNGKSTSVWFDKWCDLCPNLECLWLEVPALHAATRSKGKEIAAIRSKGKEIAKALSPPFEFEHEVIAVRLKDKLRRWCSTPPGL
ncbi:hypothetical protein Tco_0494311 [Tanacetum coccineum]